MVKSRLLYRGYLFYRCISHCIVKMRTPKFNTVIKNDLTGFTCQNVSYIFTSGAFLRLPIIDILKTLVNLIKFSYGADLLPLIM